MTQLEPILSQMSSFHPLVPYLFKIHFNIIARLRCLPGRSSLQIFRLKFYVQFSSPTGLLQVLPKRWSLSTFFVLSSAVISQAFHSQKSYTFTYLLSPWCRIFFEKLLVTHVIKQTAFFMEPEGSLPRSQRPATGPYHEPAESSSPHRSLSPYGQSARYNPTYV